MNLKQLSQHLNLSQTTVSRALNGYPEVSEKTRERVQKAARELNYSPNARAQSLATGRSQAIGHVLPVSSQYEIVNPIFGDFIAGAGQTYAAQGYEMMISLVEDNAEEELYRTIRTRGSVDGLILHAPRPDDSRIPFLTALNMPFVVHGRASEATVPYSWIDTNNGRAFARATDMLLDLGHRRVGLVNGLETLDFAQRRREAFTSAMAARGLTPDPAHMFQDEMTEAHGYQSTIAMLDTPSPPTAILSASMITAIGIRRAIHDRGLEMGRDVSVVTHDDDLSYLHNGVAEPIFTATRSPVHDAGRLAAEMLLHLIAKPGSGPQTRMLEAELIIGASTGPAPA